MKARYLKHLRLSLYERIVFKYNILYTASQVLRIQILTFACKSASYTRKAAILCPLCIFLPLTTTYRNRYLKKLTALNYRLRPASASKRSDITPRKKVISMYTYVTVNEMH